MMYLSESHLRARNELSFSLKKVNKLYLKLKQLLDQWQHNYCSRRQLAGLDQLRLKDIGLTPAQARRESSKPFWKK